MTRWRSSCSLLSSCLARRHAPVALHSSSAGATVVPGKHTTASTSIDFSDTKKSFQNKSNYELWRAFVLFKLFKYETLVDKSEKLLGILKSILGSRLFTKVMKATVFGHFVAGESREEVKSTLMRLESQGILPILAYSAEDDVTESETKSTSERDAATERACDNNLKNAIDCLNIVADASQYPFSATKITGLGHTSLLLLLSEVLVGSERVFSLLADKPDLLEGVVTSDSFLRGTEKMKLGMKESETEKLWKTLKTNKSSGSNDGMNFFEWNDAFLTDRSDFYEVLAKHSPHQLKLPVMSDKERDQMKNIMRRMESLADVAQERGVRLMVDAEHTYYQPAIRHITVHRLMPKYNMKSPLIYNTQQCYLRSSFDDLLRDIAASEHYGYRFAVKTVRGAYVTLEKSLALKKGYSDPIWAQKSETDSGYHRVLSHVLERVGDGKASIMVATQNEDTVHFALKKINELGLSKTDSSVVFGQQYGMSDNLTCTLGSSGLMAYKYTPYGPVDEVLPYLIRRANENKGMLDGAVRERNLISRELKRRLMRKN